MKSTATRAGLGNQAAPGRLTDTGPAQTPQARALSRSPGNSGVYIALVSFNTFILHLCVTHSLDETGEASS